LRRQLFGAPDPAGGDAGEVSAGDGAHVQAGGMWTGGVGQCPKTQPFYSAPRQGLRDVWRMVSTSIVPTLSL
jgi:hypothetical protein